MLANKNAAVDALISLVVPEEELINRILSRGHGRSDDTVEGIKNRLTVYKNETKPVLDYYSSKKEFHEIDGNLQINQISEKMLGILNV